LCFQNFTAISKFIIVIVISKLVTVISKLAILND
jgi:hypothetical protein